MPTVHPSASCSSETDGSEPRGASWGPPPTSTSLGQGALERYKQPLSVEPEGHGSCTPEGSMFPGLVGSLSNRQFYLWTSLPGVRWQSLFWILWRWKLDSQRVDALLYSWPQRKQRSRGLVDCLYFQGLGQKRSRELKTLVFHVSPQIPQYSFSRFQWGFVPPEHGPAQELAKNLRE